MAWLILAFMSAALLGCYDSFKKQALKANAVIPVLFLNTLFSSLIFLPFIVLSANTEMLDGTIFHVSSGGWEVHRYVVLKAFIVLSSWVLGYFGMKHLPLTIVGPINATRPVMVLVGALLVYGERLNLWQWLGVLLAVLSFFMLSRSPGEFDSVSRSPGEFDSIDFPRGRIRCVATPAPCRRGRSCSPPSSRAGARAWGARTGSARRTGGNRCSCRSWPSRPASARSASWPTARVAA